MKYDQHLKKPVLHLKSREKHAIKSMTRNLNNYIAITEALQLDLLKKGLVVYGENRSLFPQGQSINVKNHFELHGDGQPFGTFAVHYTLACTRQALQSFGLEKNMTNSIQDYSDQHLSFAHILSIWVGHWTKS